MANIKLIVVRIRRTYKSTRNDTRHLVRDAWERHHITVSTRHLRDYGIRGTLSRHFAKWEGR